MNRQNEIVKCYFCKNIAKTYNNDFGLCWICDKCKSKMYSIEKGFVMIRGEDK